ncbi:MAG TPA: S1C family serine protease [Beijerinckiaceae bacterium]|nr:S1C family serine protease [Beijerinckiaceae bacterium]
MAAEHWKAPAGLQPRPEDYAFDLERALSSVVGLTAHVSPDAFTAETLGTDRAGHGALIGEEGLVLTIGYLIAEANAIWVTLPDGRIEAGHVLAYDHESGFGLVQILAHVDLPALKLGESSEAALGERVIVAGAGGRRRSVAARVVARQDFTGYWEYMVEDAIFTAPGHPNWGGAALIGGSGKILGIGSLQLEQEDEKASRGHVNMIVPIDLLKPIYQDLITIGRRRTPPRPWLGVYAADVNGQVVIVGLSSRGPANDAGLRVGDIVLQLAGSPAGETGRFFRALWSLGPAGVEARLVVLREGRTLEVRVKTADRAGFLVAPKLH